MRQQPELSGPRLPLGQGRNVQSGRTTIVIFGATGDLARRKLIPALFSIHTQGALPEGSRLVGVSRTAYDGNSFRQHALGALDGSSPAGQDKFSRLLSYFQGSADDTVALRDLDRLIFEEAAGGPDNRLYYLALAPSLYPSTLTALGAAGMLDESRGWRRIVIEKPIGYDLASARSLNRTVHAVADERQVFRIDHYLGKDTVQNLLVFRFANSIFEPLWNRNYVDHVQISVLESVDVAGRGEYYDKSGVLRDMFQSHLLQLLALVAMEPPVAYRPDALRDEKAKVLAAIRRLSSEQAASESVRAQYDGYLAEPNVTAGSGTATYGALQLNVDNWRWHGIPFFLRSGKALNRKATEVVIQFRQPPHTIFDLGGADPPKPNALHISIQPDEGVHLSVENKAPGAQMGTQTQVMKFHFPPGAFRDAYERLLLDALHGDASLFTRSDEVELAWEIIDPFVQAWESPSAPPLYQYPRGSWGPDAGDELIGPGRRWLVHRTAE